MKPKTADCRNLMPLQTANVACFQRKIKLPYFSTDNARVIYTKRSKFVKNEHALYTAVYISLGCALSIEKYSNIYKKPT